MIQITDPQNVVAGVYVGMRNGTPIITVVSSVEGQTTDGFKRCIFHYVKSNCLHTVHGETQSISPAILLEKQDDLLVQFLADQVDHLKCIIEASLDTVNEVNQILRK